jgi:hypothetical protein
MNTYRYDLKTVRKPIRMQKGEFVLFIKGNLVKFEMIEPKASFKLLTGASLIYSNYN